MEIPHYVEQLRLAGLTNDQAVIYEALLRKGSLSAREIAKETTVPRTLGYAVLEQLLAIGLVKKDGSKKIIHFLPSHPAILQERIDAQQKQAERASTTLKASLPELSSLYNLTSGKPGIQFFEGMQGIKQVLDDSLTSKTEIYSYVDIAAVEKYIPDISRDFAKARRHRDIKKKNIGIDTPENRAEIEGYYTDVTEERLLPSLSNSFGTVMQIYDGRISYFTLGQENPIGVIITDKNIYEMHKTLFELNWNDPRAYIPEDNRSKAA